VEKRQAPCICTDLFAEKGAVSRVANRRRSRSVEQPNANANANPGIANCRAVVDVGPTLSGTAAVRVPQLRKSREPRKLSIATEAKVEASHCMVGIDAWETAKGGGKAT
jgi:hypothetical protein